jgi:hypothetical protein
VPCRAIIYRSFSAGNENSESRIRRSKDAKMHDGDMTFKELEA